LGQEKAQQKQKSPMSRDFSNFAKIAPGIVAPGAPKLLRQQKNEVSKMAGAAAAPAFTDSKIAPPPAPVVAGNVQPQAAPPLPSLTAPVSADAAATAPEEKDSIAARKENKKDATPLGSTAQTVVVQAETMSRNMSPLKSKFREAFIVSSPDNKSMWRVGTSG